MKVPAYLAERYLDSRYNLRGSRPDFRLGECPMCGHGKFSCSFHSEYQRLHGFCCDEWVSFIDLVKRELATESLVAVFEHLNRYSGGGLPDLATEDTDPAKEIRRKLLVPDLSKLNVPDEGCWQYWANNWNTEIGRTAWRYAQKRAIPSWFIQLGRMGYFTQGKMRNRLCFATCENDLPVYACGRALLPGQEPKYLNPAADVFGVGAGDVVFNLDLVDTAQEAELCEGAISALSCSNGIAIHGKALSELQAHKIARKCRVSGVVVLREPLVPVDTAFKNAQLLEEHGCPARVGDLIDGDPNDNPEQVEAVKNSAVQATLINQMRKKLGL